MYQDRKFQLDQVNETWKQLLLERVVLMQDPTGAGKTVMFCMLAKIFLRYSEKSVLVVVNRKELLSQASEQIQEITGFKPFIIDANQKRYGRNRVYVAMVDSLTNRMHLFENVGMVIIDECHVANFNKITSLFLQELILGCTATPIATSKKLPLKNFYNKIVVGPQIQELIELGFLSQNITRTPKEFVDSSNFAVDKMSEDYNIAQMAATYSMQKYVINVVKEYRKFCRGEKTIVFNVNIAHSNQVSECFQAMGYNARHLGSDNENEREEILKWFKETKDAILCNVMIATVGFDEPSVRNIILNFSTLSLVKYIQCCGRGSRVMDERFISEKQHLYRYQLETKDYFNIIDMGGNSGTNKFGDWNQDRDWEYIFFNPPEPGDGVAPVKTCPQCDGLVYASLKVCNLRMFDGSDCNYVFTKPNMVEQDIEEMVLRTLGINAEELMNKSRKKYMYYPMLAMCPEVINKMIEVFGKNPDQNTVDRYYRLYFKACEEWYERSFAGKDNMLDPGDFAKSVFHTQLAYNNFANVCKVIIGEKLRPTSSYVNVSTAALFTNDEQRKMIN